MDLSPTVMKRGKRTQINGDSFKGFVFIKFCKTMSVAKN